MLSLSPWSLEQPITYGSTPRRGTSVTTARSKQHAGGGRPPSRPGASSEFLNDRSAFSQRTWRARLPWSSDGGTAYVSAWLARRGARPIGIDPSTSQLAIARRFQVEFGLEFPLIQAAGEHVPLADGSVDLVISEYGAAIWADPFDWIPQASRLLRSGGSLIFLWEQHAAHALRSRRGRKAGEGAAPAPPVRHASIRVARRSDH